MVLEKKRRKEMWRQRTSRDEKRERERGRCRGGEMKKGEEFASIGVRDWEVQEKRGSEGIEREGKMERERESGGRERERGERERSNIC
jgi:hypothetical protein